ncbi:predicted glycosylase [Chthonomonas calidirosea]|uniref:Predicted glycosylase n=1 Tax=Chthonomonas calidirosea (strain DSM 23976 / ICMP 18418 / T49) TaxID=1303518 RepID=S0EY39_CHTCT|nr:glycoside hydrolase family 130 protein [Chthonomonas calidirosea]CCW36629.1 Predicted glycosylase [Chthonomonas calidirosea T49]CEK16760.1 predicted glycosylase [Chthonomonas calidirosea]
MRVQRIGPILKPDSSRVLFRAFNPMGDRQDLHVVARIMALPEQEVYRLLEQVMKEFQDRHYKLRSFFLKRFEEVRPLLLTDAPLSEERRLLIGAYFTHEYALEAAALFNPSIVWHPDQSGLPEGVRRFVLSLRATGEGHISSITFREGTIDADNHIVLEKPTRYVSTPEIVPNPTYDRNLFERKLYELDLWDDFAAEVLACLNEQFTLEELKEALQFVEKQRRGRYRGEDQVARGILALAQANYEVFFSPDEPLSERVLFPTSPTEVNGMEDARFVQFHEDDGRVIYYATYTAYDGKVVFPQILETEDFLHFRISTLNGPEVQNKGMALFPRRIHGRYAMLSRQDNENLYIMFSDMLHFWYTKQPLLKPTYPWEYVQVGNCGSPIETEAGWLVLSHGVGPMRKYSIGAFLLDREDPTKVIGRLKEPLLMPNADEREGYVPNVVYSCGGVLHNGYLILPYAMSDYASRFAIVPLEDILEAMVWV